ncbi:hypothetical protein BH11VER1_BH11VER1_29820 [soil metagenome]
MKQGFYQPSAVTAKPSECYNSVTRQMLCYLKRLASNFNLIAVELVGTHGSSHPVVSDTRYR